MMSLLFILRFRLPRPVLVFVFFFVSFVSFFVWWCVDSLGLLHHYFYKLKNEIGRTSSGSQYYKYNNNSNSNVWRDTCFLTYVGATLGKMSWFSHVPICSFLVDHQRMDIRRISQENIYKLFIQLQIGKYAYIPISNIKCIYAHACIQTYAHFHVHIHSLCLFF